MAPASVTAAQVRAYRILATGLDRTALDASSVPGWLLGLQDRDGSSLLALAARLRDPGNLPVVGDPGATGPLALVWSLRGSPHLHQRADLPDVAAALWPQNTDDAVARLAGDAERLRGDDADPLSAFPAVADVLRTVITKPMTKGEASAAVTDALPARYSGFCAGCKSVHIRELLFRLAALPAAIGLVPGTKPVVLAPLSPSFPTPTRSARLTGSADAVPPAVLTDRVAEYFRLFGPGSAAQVATFFGTSATVLRPALPDDLVPVQVDGTRSQLPAALLDTIRAADPDAAAGITRLLPPSDLLLQPRDRATLTTDTAQQRALWPAIGLPGAVLAGGGIAGLWRTKAAGRRLTVTITPWRTLTSTEQQALQAESEVAGTVRGAAATTLAYA